MKVFLSQLEFLPKAILFWNTHRLQRKGWRWSPFSFLRKDLGIDAPLKGGARGYLTEEGLFVKCSATRLRSSSVLHRSDNLTQQPGRYDHLCIEWSVHAEEVQNALDPANHEMRTPHEAKMVWKWIQLPRPLHGQKSIRGLREERSKQDIRPLGDFTGGGLEDRKQRCLSVHS